MVFSTKDLVVIKVLCQEKDRSLLHVFTIDK